MMLRALLIGGLAAVALLAGAGPATAAPMLGVQVHPLWSSETAEDLRRDVEHLADLGVDVARADVGWSSLQGAGPGEWASWYVERLDRFMALAGARGIRVIATLTETPCWASTAPPALRRGCRGAWWERGVQDYAPADPRAYGRAARFLAQRYGTGLAAIEVWNEPNLSYEFRTPAGGKAAAYAALVRAAYTAVKRGDRRVPVLAGATAYSDVGFLRRVYRAGIRGFHDGISIHPYSDGRGPASEAAPAELEFGAGIRSVRAAQLAAGQPKPLWLTEFGFSSCSWCGSLEQQAALIAETVRYVPRLPYVRAATVYQLRDTSTLPGDRESNFGLLRQDHTPRPAYAAFKAAVAAVRAQRPRAARSR